MRVILERHLQDSELAPVRVQECRITNTRRRDGLRGATQYELRLEDASTGRIWDQIVTGITFGGDRTRRVWETISRTAEPPPEATVGSVLPNFAYVRELDLLTGERRGQSDRPLLDRNAHGSQETTRR